MGSKNCWTTSTLSNIFVFNKISKIFLLKMTNYLCLKYFILSFFAFLRDSLSACDPRRWSCDPKPLRGEARHFLHRKGVLRTYTRAQSTQYGELCGYHSHRTGNTAFTFYIICLIACKVLKTFCLFLAPALSFPLWPGESWDREISQRWSGLVSRGA